MSASHPAMDEQIPPSSAIQQAITAAKAGHPDSVVVYFIRHKSAASSLSKPTKPLMMFRRDIRVEEVFYALYQQIQLKGLSFYVLKSESNNLLSYMNVAPGQTIGQLYDAYSYNNYLALIYNQGPLRRWKFTATQLRIIRVAFIIGMAWLVMNLYPAVQSYLNPRTQWEQVPGVSQES